MYSNRRFLLNERPQTHYCKFEKANTLANPARGRVGVVERGVPPPRSADRRSRLGPGLESNETRELTRELVVSATLGGVCRLASTGERSLVMRAACGTVDEGLVAALQHKALSAAERLQLRALRVYLHAKVRLLVKMEMRDKVNGADA